jgi:hypothetical protein
MSERLTKALEFANYRLTLNNQLVSLRSKLQTKLIYSINGGTFTITRELITFVDSLIRQKNTTDIVLIDNFQNPIMIEDLEDFLENIC